MCFCPRSIALAVLSLGPMHSAQTQSCTQCAPSPLHASAVVGLGCCGMSGRQLRAKDAV